MPPIHANVLALFGELVIKLICVIQTACYSSQGHDHLAGLFDFCLKNTKTGSVSVEAQNQEMRWRK